MGDDLRVEGTDGTVPLEEREPIDFVESMICDFCEDISGIDRLDPHVDLFVQGVNSLEAAKLVARLSRFFSVRIPLATLATSATIRDLAIAVRATPGAEVSQRFVLAAGRPGDPAFWCVHAQSGEVFFLRTLRQDPPPLALHGIRAVGLDGEQAPLETIDAMADRYVEELIELQPDGPYRLGGLCMGGVIAFEMARRLTDAGHEVAEVHLLDTTVFPDGRCVSPDERLTDRELIMQQMAESDAALPARAGATGEAPEASPESFWHDVVETLKAKARLPVDMDVQLYRDRLHVLATNSVAIAEHVLEPADVAVVLYVSADLAAEVPDPLATWGRFARRGVETVEVEVSHFDVLYSSRLRERLGRAATTPHSGRPAVTDAEPSPT